MNTPARRLASSAVSSKSSSLLTTFLPFLHPSLIHRRSFLGRIFGRKKEPKKFLDPLSPDYLKRKPVTEAEAKLPQQGDLADSSIFSDPSPSKDPMSKRKKEIKIIRDPSITAAALDPKPFLRERWQRKMTIRSIRGRYRMSKTVKIVRTERSSLSKSQFLKTSVKKLGPLARQIAGKPIEDAIVQMRFSKKKAAADVKKILEYARDEAIVKRGMGLGQVRPADGEVDARGEDKGEVVGPGRKKIMVVEDRKGRKRVVTDRTGIYVDEAWVGRGPYGRAPDYRARGQVYMMRPPCTSISLVLKEEATRIRLAEERERKRQRKKVWVPLPDRPVTAQRQYCLW